MTDLAPLRYFHAAYDSGSFSAAARVHQVSQPTVSAAIARLETQYGGQLFLRGGSGLAPTALGHELYQQSAPVLAQLRRMQDHMAGRAARQVRVFCQPDIFPADFQPGLQALRQQQMMVLQFTHAAERADLLLCSQDCLPRGCGFHPMWQERYGVALPLGHPLAAQGAVAPADLAQEALISRPYCPNADQALRQVAGLFATAAEAQHDAQLLDLVAAGLGIALVPMSHGRAHAGITVRPLKQAQVPSRQVGLGYRKNSFAADLARAFPPLAAASAAAGAGLE